MKLAVVILSFNTKELLQDCLSSIFEKKWQTDFEVWLVDNGSADGSAQMVKKNFPKVKLIESKENLGFTGGNNLALKKAQADYYLLLNSDTVVLDGSIDKLINFADNHDFGILSCKLLNKDKTLQPNAGDLPTLFPTFVWLSGLDDVLFFLKNYLPSVHKTSKSYYLGQKEVGWVSGSVMLIKDQVVKKIGGLDEKIFMYGEDLEYCLRAYKNGFKVGWTDSAQIIHLGGGSTKNASLKQWLGEFKGLLYVYKKYYGQVSASFLKILIYFFVTLRIIAFSLIGKFNSSKTYAKILVTI